MGALLVVWFLDRIWLPLSGVGEVMVLSALGLGQVFALVAAGHVVAEETTAGTDVFLARLPVSRFRLTVEKVAAGSTAVVLLFLLQASFHLVAIPFGGLWSVGSSPVGIMEEAMTEFVDGLPVTVETDKPRKAWGKDEA